MDSSRLNVSMVQMNDVALMMWMERLQKHTRSPRMSDSELVRRVIARNEYVIKLINQELDRRLDAEFPA